MKQASSSTRLAGVLTVAVAALLDGCNMPVLDHSGPVPWAEEATIHTATLLEVHERAPRVLEARDCSST